MLKLFVPLIPARVLARLRSLGWLGWVLALPLPVFFTFQQPFLRYENLPFPPLVREIHAGHPVALLVRRCSTSAKTQTYLTTHSLDSLDGGKDIILQAVPVQVTPGCTDAISVVTEIPAETPPGLYRVIGTAEVPGVARNFKVEWYSSEFRVLPANTESKPMSDRSP